ncbi:MAG: efflux transporter outer membrane subunit [Alphaproteobacteria bacterium]|nr:efflux transporter outer membrane subunit [Alphaproteobacteria bacterium]
MRKLQKFVGLMLPITLLTACEVGPDYERPDIDMPKLSKQDIKEFTTAKWWNVFHDPVLNALEDAAIKNNADLKQAIANVDIAKAEAGIAFGDLLPSVGLQGAGQKDFASRRGKFAGLAPSRHSLDYTSSATASYELDFFGKYRRANEAARAMLLSTRAAKESVLLTVTSETAKAYFLLKALDAQLAIARRTLKTRQETYNVYKSRLKNGYCTEFDYLRIEAEMSSVESAVSTLAAAQEKAENALSVLIGCSPREMVSRKTAKSDAINELRIPVNIPQGIPSDILARRPDVLQAEGMLIAANAKIGVARAAYFPSISLTGAYGFESQSLGQLFRTGSDMWSFGGGISLPIFAGGKISAAEDSANAGYRKMLAAYEKSIQMAFKDTLDALVSNRHCREIVRSTTRQVNALKKGYSIARKQKEAGLIGLIDLLDVERGLLSAEMELVTALQNQLNATVDLCKALGGGWTIDSLNENRK